MNKLNRKQQRVIFEILAVVSLLLLIVVLSHINISSANDQLQEEIERVNQENTALKYELDKSNSEVVSLEYQLEQAKK